MNYFISYHAYDNVYVYANLMVQQNNILIW